MAVIVGTRLFGGTDAVPGVFHVATKFCHFDFFPLIPLGSYIILESEFNSTSGVQIELSGKSVALGYIRAVGVIGVISTGFWAYFTLSDQAVASFLLTCLVASLLMWHKSTRNASYKRASELASEFGPTVGPVCQLLIDAHFGRVAYAAVPTGDEETFPEESSGLEFSENVDEDYRNQQPKMEPNKTREPA